MSKQYNKYLRSSNKCLRKQHTFTYTQLKF